MKKIVPFLLYSFLLIVSCSPSEKDASVSVKSITLNFSHNWYGTEVTNTNFNNIEYTNANGEQISITKLRYLISRVTFHKPTGENFVLLGYNMVDVTSDSGLSYTQKATLPSGTYNKVTFIFGFDNDDNIDGAYQDLNSTSWNVPAMLGGGYHFMQLEGKFIDDTLAETGYAYHVIKAVDNSGATQIFENTFFEVDLGETIITNNVTFNVEMNIAEWFKNPNTWNLNALNNMLMPNYDAQIMMYENGQNVFSLKSVTQ